jgi:hypothetical protein
MGFGTGTQVAECLTNQSVTKTIEGKCMKYLLLVLSLVLSESAIADVCALENPIKLNGGQFSLPLHLKNVRANEAVRFSENDISSSVDELVIDIFNISQDSIPTSFVGVNLSRAKKLDSVGSANDYSGNLIELSGVMKANNGEVLYSMTDIHRYKINNQDTQAITSTTVIVKDGAIVSINIKNPVYRLFAKENGIYVAQFTGEEQDLWICSASM